MLLERGKQLFSGRKKHASILFQPFKYVRAGGFCDYFHRDYAVFGICNDAADKAYPPAKRYRLYHYRYNFDIIEKPLHMIRYRGHLKR